MEELKAKKISKRKKRILIVAVVLLLLFVLFLVLAFALPYIGIKNLNNNFNGEYKFAVELDSVEITGDFIIEPFSGRLTKYGGYVLSLRSTDSQTRYYFKGFPDAGNTSKLTSIETRDSRYSFFGFSVGDSIEAATNILEQNNYKYRKPPYPTAEFILYKLGHITFTLYGDGDIIEQINVSLSTTHFLSFTINV